MSAIYPFNYFARNAVAICGSSLARIAIREMLA
jgi:hypothetical protein